MNVADKIDTWIWARCDEIAKTTQLRDKYTQQLEELAQSADGRSGAEAVKMKYILQRHIKTLENAMAEMAEALMPSSPTAKSGP